MFRAVSAQSLGNIPPKESIIMIHECINNIKSQNDANLLKKYINDQFIQITNAIYHYYAKKDYESCLQLCEFLINTKDFSITQDYRTNLVTILYIDGCTKLNLKDYQASYSSSIRCESNTENHDFIALSRLARSYCLVCQNRAEQSLVISTPLISIPEIRYQSKDLAALATILSGKIDQARTILEQQINDNFVLNITHTADINLPKPSETNKKSKSLLELELAALRPSQFSV
ncbi:hypothetical protein TVAG_123450 [Trichomonas vaginalis G3]|uniref:Uncharacterized protein n=1 Tax=Trichomonas vaginalis (strain ATCC PRA-98 / G3) TaxID=412133 RepID=A2FCS1_TRIV3|nr:hypothetical protein TVAGG3_0516590 [Trichomonas vaginalis G3]EAX97295.1 hypothetical protein TVAG_123450 [Trichomonas vaginalis G3]KAI5518178.1 hypothetical protein TVAGG3_0516590 [Trichomonas vaginalis G3]|eukprot:XP_001310225.1 hypothetical protein [Trichomonas vaginalis G3]